MDKWSVKLGKVNSNTLYAGLCLLVAAVISVVYSEQIHKDPILKRDDVLLILPLKPATTISKYVDDVASNAILDFQPVRDLSFILDIKFIEISGLSSFHATNAVIFLGVLFVLFKLLEALGFSKNQVVCSGLLFAVHPIMVSSIGWISARKHTLALFFLLLSLLSFVKHKNITKTAIFLYVVSILSHQIFILFPLWLFVYSHVKKIKIKL